MAYVSTVHSNEYRNVEILINAKQITTDVVRVYRVVLLYTQQYTISG